MKKTLPRLLLASFVVIALLASWIGGAQESTILREQMQLPSSSHTEPLEIKGKTYFVTNDQLRLYVWSRRIFVAGCAAALLLILGMRHNRRPDE